MNNYGGMRMVPVYSKQVCMQRVFCVRECVHVGIGDHLVQASLCFCATHKSNIIKLTLEGNLGLERCSTIFSDHRIATS